MKSKAKYFLLSVIQTEKGLLLREITPVKGPKSGRKLAMRMHFADDGNMWHAVVRVVGEIKAGMNTFIVR